MSQILRRLSETDSVEEKSTARLAAVPENIFDEPESELSDAPKNTHVLFKRFGISFLVVALVAIGIFSLRKKEKLIPIVDFTKILQQEVALLNRQATESFYSGDFDKAADLLKHAESLDPNNITSKINMGIILRHQNKRNEAIAEFNQVLAVSPENPAALNGLGRVQLDNGALVEAENYFKRASASSPQQTETLLNLGELAELKDDWVLAAQYYDRYLQNPTADSALKILVSRRSQNIAAITKARK
jgi:tetratricopeptide (TPR) repeat protein